MYKIGNAFNKLRKSISEDFDKESDSRSVKDLSNKSKILEKESSLVIKQTYEEEGDDDDFFIPVTLEGYAPTTKHRLLSPEMCDELRTLMPTRIQLFDKWELLYSLEQHGASIQSLFNRVNADANPAKRVGYVLIIEDRLGGIFGGYTNEPFHPTEKHAYYGNGECFLWKLEKVPDININEVNGEKKLDKNSYRWSFKGFPHTGINEFSIYCTAKFLSMGAGEGHYGLWCDDSLFKGVCNPCLTYGNEVLSSEGKKFHIVNLEVWKIG